MKKNSYINIAKSSRRTIQSEKGKKYMLSQLNGSKLCGKSMIYAGMLCLLSTASYCFSQTSTSAQMVTLFSDLFNGRYAKIIWETRVSGQAYGNQVWGMDTKDCIPHQITRTADLAPSSAQLYYPVMTWDQQRVLVTNGNNMTIYIANWDGSGLKQVVTGYFSAYAWRQNSTDWILAAPKTSPAANNASVYRVNIDTPSVKVLLWNKTLVGSGTSFHAGLSVDGTRMCENYPHPNMGIATVPNGSIVFSKPQGTEICVPTMSQDNKYQCLCWSNTHTAFVIFDTSGNVLLNKDFTGALPFNSSSNEAAWLRWSNDADIATVDNYVVRISDLHNVNLGTLVTSPVAIQVFIYGAAGVTKPVQLNMNAPHLDAPLTLFDCLGRKSPGSFFTPSKGSTHFTMRASGMYLMKKADETNGSSRFLSVQ